MNAWDLSIITPLYISIQVRFGKCCKRNIKSWGEVRADVLGRFTPYSCFGEGRFTPKVCFYGCWGKNRRYFLPQSHENWLFGVKRLLILPQQGCFRWVGVKHAPNNQAETLLCALLNQFGVLFLDILVI